jgi:hypothetical protein
MIKMNKKLKDIMSNTTEREKIRLFYELAKFFNEKDDGEYENDKMEELFADIANVVNDIENI